MSRLGGAGRGLTRLTRAKNVPSFTSVTSCKATNRVFMPLQALQSSKTGFLCHCRRCNRPKPGFCTIAGVAIVQNRVFMPLQALQSSKTGFLHHCRHCNCPESDSGGFAWSAMAQNQILEELQGLQWLRIRFWRNCTVCNGSESDSGGIARSAMAQNQILEDLHGLQMARNQILGCPAHKPRAGDGRPPRLVGVGRCDSCRSRSRQTKNLGEKRVGTVSRMKG